jgi:cytochrome b6-f complex iron-sulfur subunit
VEKPQNRRKFLAKSIIGLLGLVLISVVYTFRKYFLPAAEPGQVSNKIRVGMLSEIPEDGVKIFRVEKKAFAVIRTGQGQIRAYSAVCTHQGCIVGYQSNRKLFHCNCHGSEFDLNGKNIAGPAPKPLPALESALENDQIFITPL